MPPPPPASGPRVEIHDDPDALLGALRAELTAVRTRRPEAVVSFATGATFAPLFRSLAADPGPLQGLRCTHLDEYLGFGPRDPGGMVHELLEACPPLRAKLDDGSFLPVPGNGDPAALAAHAETLRAWGGIDLQLLGIGRNGHLAFNEPGTPADARFHRAVLAPTTRDDVRPRFAPAAPPAEAVTAGLADILDARRIVLVARGASKAPAVAAMFAEPVGPACPATVLRGHGAVLVLLDPAAGRGLRDTRSLEHG